MTGPSSDQLLSGTTTSGEPSAKKGAPMTFENEICKARLLRMVGLSRYGGIPITLPLLEAKTVSEAYVAMMAWLPMLKPELVTATIPFVLSGTCAKKFEPSQNETIPVGVPAPPGLEATVAVKTTFEPVPGAEFSVVVVA